MPDSLIQPVLAGSAAAAALFVGFILLEASVRPFPPLATAEGAAVDVRARQPLSRRRLFAIAAALVLLAAAASGCVFLNTYDPLRATGPATGSGPLYLGTIPATYAGVDSVEFAAVSGGEMLMDFSLTNSGDLPLTIVGVANPITNTRDWQGTMFQSGRLSVAGLAQDGTAGRFEIAAHAAVPVRLTLRCACLEGQPTPTLAPGHSPSAAVALAAAGYGAMSIASLPVDYEVLGFQHSSKVALPADLAMIAISRVPCGSAPVTPDQSSGLHVTPVPSIVYP